MPRRKTYTRVLKTNQVRADHVKGMSDTAFKGFQCLNSECTNIIFVKSEDLTEEFDIECPICHFHFKSGEETKFFDYQLEDERDDTIIEDGEFSVLHDDYIAEAQEYKYCINCNTMKPLYMFDNHQSKKCGHQGECRLCKQIYNSIKNQTRTTDQHREAAQKRRMYLDLAAQTKIDEAEIYKRFGYKCFKCGKDLSNVAKATDRPLDHTLPIYYLYPMDSRNATLLCQKHNGEKSGKWPSEYYSSEELKKLSIITGIPYDLINGKPQYNPTALEKLSNTDIVNGMITKYSAYIDEIIKLRNRILRDTGLDFFKYSNISPVYIEKADSLLK